MKCVEEKNTAASVDHRGRVCVSWKRGNRCRAALPMERSTLDGLGRLQAAFLLGTLAHLAS